MTGWAVAVKEVAEEAVVGAVPDVLAVVVVAGGAAAVNSKFELNGN